MNNKAFTKHYILMMIPGFLWLFVFSIIPMFGILMAFENYSPVRGILGSQWVGLQNFKIMFQQPDMGTIVLNTLSIAIQKIVLNLVVPLIFALMLNEVRFNKLKRTVQTIVYLPYFLSWVILAGVLKDIFSLNGFVNSLFQIIGIKPILFFARADLFQGIVVASDVWKGFGFNAIIYLAAITGINPALYEAAKIDGAGRFKCIWNITLPGIRNTVVLLMVLSLGGVLNAGFEQVFNLYNPLVYSTGDIIDTWVYRMGLVNLEYSLATAVGLLKSVIGFILIILSYALAYKYANYKIF